MITFLILSLFPYICCVIYYLQVLCTPCTHTVPDHKTLAIVIYFVFRDLFYHLWYSWNQEKARIFPMTNIHIYIVRKWESKSLWWGHVFLKMILGNESQFDYFLMVLRKEEYAFCNHFSLLHHIFNIKLKGI